jgi:hypothetical protein
MWKTSHSVTGSFQELATLWLVCAFDEKKAYLLTDFNEFAFLGDGCFVRTGRNQRAVPNVSANKLHLSAV